MQAMVLERPGEPLKLIEQSDPRPAKGEVRIRVAACGVCRTDLHVVDGELPNPKLPIIPGHEIVGRIDIIGDHVGALEIGQRVGVPWLGRTCGQCRYCRNGWENLCDRPLFTGYTRDGGYATHVVADARYVFALPEESDDVATAPLLCAGLIGWRSLRIAGDGRKLGLYGFGAAAHIIAQVARWQGRDVFAFTRRGDEAAQAFAKKLGAVGWEALKIPRPSRLIAPLSMRLLERSFRQLCARCAKAAGWSALEST
jgi:propanol-preferring alcohol dehydrogenase